jgi:DNA polymerase-4
VASLLGIQPSTFPKTIDGTKISIAIENAIWPKKCDVTDATTNTFPMGDPRLQWLFLDLNSYFASVEQELRPELRDRPMAVVPLLADTTCCIAASYEAKRYGVRTGTQVGEAKRLCPGIVLVEARHELYVDYHHRVVEAVESCLPVTSVMSIDEMACRLLGREQPLLAALELAREVKAAVRRKAGATLRCSVGWRPTGTSPKWRPIWRNRTAWLP